MKHPIVSADDGKGLLSAAGFVGTKDYSSWLTAPAAIEFANTLGPAKIKAYCHDLVWVNPNPNPNPYPYPYPKPNPYPYPTPSLRG
jgi:hypothetical protein